MLALGVVSAPGDWKLFFVHCLMEERSIKECIKMIPNGLLDTIQVKMALSYQIVQTYC